MTTKSHHSKEAARYDRLSKEAANQTTSAQTPGQYAKKADDHRKKAKAMKEAVTNLAFLIEDEYQKFEVVASTKQITDKLQKMAQDLAKIEPDNLMPMLDQMREMFGGEQADHFNDAVTAAVRQATDALTQARDAINNEVNRVQGKGGDTNDMALGADAGDADLGTDMAAAGDDMDMAADADMDAAGDDQLAATDMDDDQVGLDMDGAEMDLDDPAMATAAGRARKESIESNVKALRESKNPDRLVYEVFRRTLKETRNATTAAHAVAEAFAIDVVDVIDIVREGKTFKDEQGRNSGKKKDFSFDRREKKRERKDEIEEGKTFKDEEGRSAKNKDRSEERSTKKRERPSDLDEAKKFGAAEQPKKEQPVFGKRRPVKDLDYYADLENRDVKEGKTFKDEKDRTSKNKDHSEERKSKKRERDLEESSGNFNEGGVAGKPSDADLEEGVLNWIKPTQKLDRMKSIRPLDLPNKEAAQQKAQVDYQKHEGRSMEVPYVRVFVNGESVLFKSRVGKPFVVRVDHTEADLIDFWKGDTINPRWRVTVRNGQGVIPTTAKRGWIDGPAYRVSRLGTPV